MRLDRDRRALVAAGVALAVLLLAAGLTRVLDDPDGGATADEPGQSPSSAETRPDRSATPTKRAPRPARPAASRTHPGGHVFGANRFLVAYYGTGGTGSLGVLGETDPATAYRRLARAAAPFARPGSDVQLVFELIVTVADGTPGKDGDYSHDVPRAVVQRYVDAARRQGVLLLLDLQTGRSPFYEVARRWEWALREPHVGLALDPEWRMARDEVPGRVIGAVNPGEVNATSWWLDGLTRRLGLPEKLFVLHQFRTGMLLHPERIEPRPRLAMVQHVDGFGTPGQKMSTYRAVERAGQFRMGFKLFYDEDRPRMSARDVRRIKPVVRFVSFQ